MNKLDAVLVVSLMTLDASAVWAQGTVAPVGPAVQRVPPGPDQIYGPPPDDGSGIDPSYADPNAGAEVPPEPDLSRDNSAAQVYEDGWDPDASQQFEGALSPYGTWVDDDTYGRVWVPATDQVGDDFAPYASNGDWTQTEYGWTWASGWSWGWAPFHYGRWAAAANRGWCWIPGTLWGPAWVSWRFGGGYVGWAALPPRGQSVARPYARNTPWRFTAVTSFGAHHASFVSARAHPGIFSRTVVVSDQRVLEDGARQVWINAGPSATLLRIGRAGRAVPRPQPLAQVAPQALPRIVVQSYPGTASAARPWEPGYQRPTNPSTSANSGSHPSVGPAPRPSGRPYGTHSNDFPASRTYRADGHGAASHESAATTQRSPPPEHSSPPERPAPPEHFAPPERPAPPEHFAPPERPAPPEHSASPEHPAPFQRPAPPQHPEPRQYPAPPPRRFSTPNPSRGSGPSYGPPEGSGGRRR